MEGTSEIRSELIPSSALTWKRQVHRGDQSVVYKGRLGENDVAIKIILQEIADDECERAVHPLMALNHSRVVQLKGVCIEQNALVLDWVQGETLAAFLEPHAENWIPLQTLHSLGLDVACGMAYLHSLGRVHGRLNSTNVMLVWEEHPRALRAKITCCSFSGQDSRPEDDIRGFGDVLRDLSTRLLLCETGMPEEEPQLPVMRLIWDCLREDAGDRPTSEEVVERLQAASGDLLNCTQLAQEKSATTDEPLRGERLSVSPQLAPRALSEKQARLIEACPALADHTLSMLSEGVLQMLHSVIFEGPRVIRMCREVDGYGAAALGDALCVNKSMERLELLGQTPLSRSSINYWGAKGLAAGIKDHPSLLSVNLHSNALGNDGTGVLAKALARHPSVRELNISFNGIGEAGAISVAIALETNTAIYSLDLSFNNGIGDKAALALAKALKRNRSLQSLNLHGSSITDEGATALAEALRVNHSLTQLILSGTRIKRKGVRALAQALARNTTLKELNLSETPLRFQAGEDVRDIIFGSSLEIFKMGGSELPANALTHILQDLHEGRSTSLIQLELAGEENDKKFYGINALLVKCNSRLREQAEAARRAATATEILRSRDSDGCLVS